MNFLIDLIPALPFLLIAFIDIYLATKLAMVLAAVQLIISRLYYKRLKRMHLVTFAAIMIFGSLTLALHDDRFIVFKPTVLNWILGLCFLVAPLILKKNLLKTMLDDKLAMPDRAWASLNLMWVGY